MSRLFEALSEVEAKRRSPGVVPLTVAPPGRGSSRNNRRGGGSAGPRAGIGKGTPLTGRRSASGSGHLMWFRRL